MFVVDRKRSQSATKTRSSSLLLGCPFMVSSRLRGRRRSAGTARALFGQEREGPRRVLRVLADRAPYQNPNGPGKAWQVRFVLPGATGRPACARRGLAAVLWPLLRGIFPVLC